MTCAVGEPYGPIIASMPGVQDVNAIAGAAYGVIGADVHVHGDGTPVYLLQRWTPLRTPDVAWLRGLPSRLLNAHHQVVPFTGRAAELARLDQWLHRGARLAAHWLHGPGGQDKTRLAARLEEHN